MFYLDSQRTITRRESSLLVSGVTPRSAFDIPNMVRAQSASHLMSESGVSLNHRSKGCVRKEIITSLFESMLDSIVESWEVIEQRRPEIAASDIGKTTSDLVSTPKKKKSAVKQNKMTKKSISKLELNDNVQNELMQMCWWAAPDERAIIRFRNGNTYEGNISMKCMHGEGRYQWADGTVFLGSFKENVITGKGIIHWKDDTWYEGEFSGNLRHGRGLYVDSRNQRSYYGSWHNSTKHEEGVIYYDGSFKNSYDGEWNFNVRHGFGSREYCEMSGYKGEWDNYVREGKGLMIWPNHDFYRGEWKNGVMSGYGIYIWDTHYNNSMSSPSLCAYRGFWQRGKRHGFGLLNLGLGLGSFYRGEFILNKKHGAGKFVTNNGLILQHKHLFIDDNMSSLTKEEGSEVNKLDEPYIFDICDSSVGLIYHVEHIINNIDKEQEIRSRIVNEFIANNKTQHIVSHTIKLENEENVNNLDFKDLINFEITSLSKSLRCYETNLKHIYYQYATICNREEIHFTPVLIRLYLWQLYYDCNIHDKGLTLVEIDNMFHENREWMSKSAHNPFEKIYFWQFQHSLITVASKLHAKRQLPNKKPDTMLASAFRIFMEKDILPGAGRKKGKLAEGYGTFIPLKSLYKLYRSLGEPSTVLTFLCSIRKPPHDSHPQSKFVEDDNPNLGRNGYIFGDEMTFTCEFPVDSMENNAKSDLKLFNISNLSTKSVIQIFSFIFPQIYSNNKIMDLNIEITFFEFLEAFIVCVEESIRLDEEQCRLQEKFSIYTTAETQTLPKIVK